jgi:integrase/recombinase XerD
MTERVSTRAWYSPVGTFMALLIAEKQACGYGYVAERALLGRFDRFLAEQGLREPALPRDLVEQWVAKRPQESPGTQRLRFGLTRHFATFLTRHGYPAYIPDAHRMPRRPSSFVPYIFTHDEVGRLLQAADALPFRTSSPLRTHMVPALFRLLYSCGLRVSEALHVQVADVDLAVGVLTIRQSKFRKDRLVPLPPALTQRLRQYVAVVGSRPDEAMFFPSPYGGAYHCGPIYQGDFSKRTSLITIQQQDGSEYPTWATQDGVPSGARPPAWLFCQAQCPFDTPCGSAPRLDGGLSTSYSWPMPAWSRHQPTSSHSSAVPKSPNTVQ